MSRHENITRIKAVSIALQELIGDVVFVGGATVSLYADRETQEVRPTDDVDILVEIITYSEYSQVEEKLRNKGFANDTTSRVICRYRVHGIIVDVMPTSEEILGFSNIWYTPGFKNSIPYPIDEDTEIRVLSPAYFLATKLEAFRNRGNGDGRLSTDFEDIVFIVNNRSTIWQEINEADSELRSYLVEIFSSLISNKYIEEWISCHLEAADSERTEFIISSINNFLNSKA
ncbi:nucleotidyl transferase AbiEii/AbiGii toxin family protein [Algoriphagus aestuarii]|nr:nucleotidyl transferase AbiEii/AbiGii toxin family protein [Algoriphagus aestuarii]